MYVCICINIYISYMNIYPTLSPTLPPSLTLSLPQHACVTCKTNTEGFWQSFCYDSRSHRYRLSTQPEM